MEDDRMVNGNSTKNEILEKATEIFSMYGYQATTIRMIAEAANVNVASINYHFSSKQQLYLAVMQQAAKEAFHDFPETILTDTTTSSEKKIFLFIRYTLICLLGEDGKGTTFGKLMTFEASSCPSKIGGEILDKTIGSRTRLLENLVRDITHIEQPQQAERITACIVGQTVYFLLSDALTDELFAKAAPKSKEDVDQLCDTIYQFTITALQGMKVDN